MSAHRLIVIVTMLVTTLAGAEDPPLSKLWGANGERWDPAGRLPDFSFAGYRRGEAEIPHLEATHSVSDFGATADDDKDDSEAFLEAIAAVESGVITIPEGKFIITKPIDITNSGVVLRGAGPDKTTLYFPTPLNDIVPNMGATTGGRPTSNYSWSGGFLTIRGDYQSDVLATITKPSKRGSRTVEVDDGSSFTIGQEVEVRVSDDKNNSLAMHLYDEDPRIGIEKLKNRVRSSLVARITAIDGNTLTLDRYIRFDIRPEWKPRVHRFEPTVTECGIESMRFEFPNTDYKGHFTELGFNAFAISSASHCWVRDVHVHNADSGGFVTGYFNTVDGIVFTSDRKIDSGRNSTGHHGITLRADSVCTNFDFRCKFVHDLTVSRATGNVFSNGRGNDLSFDHHRFAPYENLFTNIDTGKGGETWRSGGGADLGAHCAARGTFWNIRAEKPIPQPSKNFGPWSLNLVGVWMEALDQTEAGKRWYEHNTKGGVAPRNLHEAQLQRRLKN